MEQGKVKQRQNKNNKNKKGVRRIPRKRMLPGKHKGKRKVKLGWHMAQPQSLPENLPVVLRENPGPAIKRNSR